MRIQSYINKSIVCKTWEDENEKEKNEEKIALKDVWQKGENERGEGL